MKSIMSRFGKIILGFVTLVALFSVPGMAPKLACAGYNDSNQASDPDFAATQTDDSSRQDYSGLSDLVTMICEDALERFQGFYGSSVVTVVPFSTLGFFEKDKQSELGMTIADQMVAMINNDTKDNLGTARGTTKQELHGVLQEVDGNLRVHLSGVNAAGQRTSFVVIVEMSEPIYRALHTYL